MKGKAIAGLVLAIVAAGCSYWAFGIVSLVLAIVGLVLSVSAKKQLDAAGEGSGIAKAGLIISIIAIVLAIVLGLTCGICSCTAKIAAEAAAQQAANGGTGFMDSLVGDLENTINGGVEEGVGALNDLLGEAFGG